MASINGVPEPAGGWQQGAWVQGRQYWGGTLSQPGQINPLSNQAGAGQQVSSEVVSQTNPANVAYLGSLKATSTEGVTQDLNKFQSDLFANASRPEVKVPTMEELKTTLAPAGGQPEPLNRVQKFEELRLSQGVEELETTLNDLKAQEDELNAQFRQQKTAERGKTVPMNVIEGRISEEERTYLEQQDYLGRQKSRVVDELNTKYNVINTYMNFYSLDYQDAVTRYNTEFQQNLSMYSIILDQEKLKVDQWYKDQAIATTNLQMYMNAVTAGNLSYGSLSTDQKMMISKLEAQSGMPIGFVGNLQIAPKDKILAFSEDKTQAMILGDNGEMKVINTGLRESGGGTASAKSTAAATADAQAGMSSKDLATKYGKTLNDYELINIYNANSPSGKMTESPETFSTWTGTRKSTTLDPDSVNAYANMVLTGEITISSVPTEYRDEVIKKLGESKTQTTGIWSRIKSTLGF